VGSQLYIALAHWKWHTPRAEKLSEALHMSWGVTLGVFHRLTLGVLDHPNQDLSASPLAFFHQSKNYYKRKYILVTVK
jgi:hypothetical protein